MDNFVVAQKAKAIALCGVGLLLAIFLGWNVGSENYGQLLLGTVIVAVASFALFSGPFFWVLTIASSFLSGTFPLLQGSFTPFQILMAMGVAKFLVGDVVLRRTPIKWGKRLDLVMLAGFMGVLTFHGLHDRFGMRFLGSNVWGGRNYINVYVGLAAFFIVQSIPITSKVWAKLPYLVLAVASFDLLIAIITTLFPPSIYVIYPFYSAVSTAGLEEIVAGTYETTSRVGAFGSFGFVVVLIVLASVSLPKLFSPANFFRLVSVGIGGLAVLVSGFRSFVVQTLVGTLMAGIRDLKWGVLVLLPVVATLLFGVSVVNSEFIRLPKQIQRGLSFVPGKWDTRMEMSAAASNDFRRKVWTVFAQEYFPVHPWLGRGFGFRKPVAEQTISRYNPNWDRDAVEVGNIHNGFLATLDALGIVGTIFFVVWNLRLLARTFRVSFRQTDPASTALRFLALYLAVLIVFYWFGAYTVGTFLPQEFALAGVFLRLQRTMDLEARDRRAVEAKSPHGVRPELASA
jgi:O-antigen ligase